MYSACDQRLVAQFIQQRPGVLQIGGVGTLGKPAVNFGEHRARFVPTPLMLGMEIAQIKFEVAGDPARWRAEIAGKVSAAAQALTGPTTSRDKRVQTMYPPGSETGGEVATWGRATSNRFDAMGVKWDATGKSSKHIPFDWSGPR